MTPTNFEGQNVVYAEDQPEYLPLPALQLGDEHGSVITCWEMTDEELQEVIKNKKIYLSVMTFNQPLQPVSVQASLDGFFDLRKPEGY
jgi:hypothetical protein